MSLDSRLAALHRSRLWRDSRLALTPWLNHGWHVPLYVHPRGLRTSTIHLGHRMFELDFDFVDHRFALLVSDGPIRGFALEPMSVATRDGAFWSAELGERLLPYDVVRSASDPDRTLLRFLQTTYRAAADLGRWDPSLECRIGVPGRPRAIDEGEGG